jgi:23S rRNA-/tRNA-specific pseudouridylate synthase
MPVRKHSGHAGRRPSRSSLEVTILHEDESILAIDKPAGLAAVPIERSNTASAWAIVAEELKRRRQKAFVVHRIDRFTTGVLLFAKTHAARDILVRQFQKHTPVRQYMAVIRGHLAEKEGKLTHYLRREGMFQKVSRESDSEPWSSRCEAHRWFA